MFSCLDIGLFATLFRFPLYLILSLYASLDSEHMPFQHPLCRHVCRPTAHRESLDIYMYIFENTQHAQQREYALSSSSITCRSKTSVSNSLRHLSNTTARWPRSGCQQNAEERPKSNESKQLAGREVTIHHGQKQRSPQPSTLNTAFPLLTRIHFLCLTLPYLTLEPRSSVTHAPHPAKRRLMRPGYAWR